MSDEEIKKDTENTSETEKQQEELHEDATKGYGKYFRTPCER
jgi:hypothetical protein